MAYGDLFKQLRKERGYTLQQLADEENSVSFISKFEKNQTNISLSRFVYLLAQMNVTIEEFFFLLNQSEDKQVFRHLTSLPGYVSSPYFETMDRISMINEQTLLSKEFKKGKQELRIVTERLTGKKRWERYCLIYIQIIEQTFDINLKGLEKGRATEELKRDALALIDRFREWTIPVVSYLYSVDNWGLFEVSLFRHFQMAFPVETSHNLLAVAVSRTEKQAGLAVMDQFKMDLIFSSFTTFINFKAFPYAKDVLTLADELLKNENDLFNSTKLIFYQGWYDLFTGHIEQGKQQCEQAISIHRILNQSHSAKRMSLILKDLLEMSRDDAHFILIFS